ncbi:MAG: PAS domain S-box protein [Bacteroidota bacterium]
MRVNAYLYKNGQFETQDEGVYNKGLCYSLVLAFGKKDLLSNTEVYAQIASKFKGAQIALCSTAGEIFDGKFYDDTISITAIQFENTPIKTAQININQFANSYDAGVALVKQLDPNDLKHVFLLSDGSIVNGSELVLGIESVRLENVNVTGGLAGDGDQFLSTVVGLNALPTSGNIVAIGFYGSAIKISYGSSGGWETFGLEQTITKSKSNELYEIDNKNALDLYRMYLGKYAKDLPGSALLFPLSVNLPGSGDTVVRTILSIDNENKSMVFAGDVPEGSKVRFMKANFDNLIEAASYAAKSSVAEVESENTKLSILISCVGRKLILKDRVDEELEAVKEVMGKHTITTGFYSYGEIAPCNNQTCCELHNQTMTVTTFEEETVVLHKLLQKQINKHLNDDIRNHPSISGLLHAINDSYQSFDQDKDFLHHAFSISEKGYQEVHNNLLNEFKLKKLSIEKLKEGLDKMNAEELFEVQNDEDGLFSIIDYVNSEISKRKVSEQVLSRNNELLTTLLSNLHSGILIENEDRKILFANDLFCEQFEIPASPQQLIGADCAESAEQNKHHFKNPEQFVSRINGLLSKREKAVDIEFEMQNGKILSLDYIPVYIEKEYKGHLWEYTDVTERKNSENTLINLNNLKENILNGTNLSLVFVDKAGMIKSFNHGAEEMLEYKAEEVVNQKNILSFFDNGELEKRAKKLSHELKVSLLPSFESLVVKVKKGFVDTNEWTYLGKDNKKQFVVLSVSLIKASVADQEGYLFVARSITEQIETKLALHESESRYKEIVEKSTDIIFKTNENGNFIFVNPVAERITGYSKDELLSLKFLDVIKDEYRLKTERFYARQIRRNIPSTYFEFPILDKNGKEIWIGQSVQLSWKDGNHFEMIALAIDISRQKKAERDIIQSNQRLELFQTLINHTYDAIEVSKEDGQLLYVNNEAANRFGIDVNRLDEYTVSDLDPMFKDELRWKRNLEELKSTDFITLESENLNQKTGEVYPVEVTMRYLQINNTGYVIANSRNISTRKKIEHLLKSQEQKYRNIIANMNLGLLEVDLDDNIRFANQSFTQMSGYDLFDLIGKKAGSLFTSPESQDLVKYKNSLRKDGISDIYELKVSNKQGELKWWLISGAPLYNESGQLIGTIGIHLDITAQKKLEEDLEKAKTKAEEGSKAKETFIANMSHEIRTPLNAITGMIRELAKENLNSKQRAYVQNSDNASKHLLSVINNILDISKIEAGELNIETEHFLLSESLNKVVTMLKPRAEEKGILLKLAIQSSVQDAVMGDALRVEQILINLLGNAIKFTNCGFVQLSCKVLRSIANGQQLELKVSDTGVGMEPAYLNRIFSKFSQEDKSTSRKYGGTGLGMAITYQLVQLMHGEIMVDSVKNKGSEFSVVLSFPKSDKVETVNSAEELLAGQLKNVNILLVEDNEMNRLVAQNTLKYYGCIITEAVNGIEAIKLLQKQSFDIILMDIQMPEMNGIEATKMIRNELKIKTPIIALTANAFKTELEACKVAGMEAYVTKPFEESILIKTILTYAKLAPTQLTLQANNSDIKTEMLYNLKRLDEISRGDASLLNKIIQLFLDQTSTTLQMMGTKLKEKDFDEVSRLAHKIKPNLLNVGIVSLKDDIDALEFINKTEANFKEMENH